MQILREIPKEVFQETGEKVIQMIRDTANMDLKEKEQWLSHIPKDYKLDNDMTIIKYRLWTEIRQDLIDKGYLGAEEKPAGQQRLEI